MPTGKPQRSTVYYIGRVQGVGFRYTTHSIARGYDVTGFVQNLADGRVELVAEGEKGEIDAFLRDVRERFAEFIRNEQRDVGPAMGEFSGFDIRH
jgi:acylphosphatase